MEGSSESCTGVPAIGGGRAERSEEGTKERGRLLNGKGLLRVPASCGGLLAHFDAVRNCTFIHSRVGRGAAGPRGSWRTRKQ